MTASRRATHEWSAAAGAIAFLAAEKDHPVNPAAQGVLLYMYTPDLAGLHAQLIASGVTVSGIGYPGVHAQR